ncbi:MAG: pyruvate dehydrogenase (acetyl-transferring) E1 component subunit alpha, partial [Gemmatimonadaceae bacterium]|nr:pyruvate dehydrogenase (acetyl-transferring) E1 component subunit alpha [Gemmatimonadaceae bacterium]
MAKKKTDLKADSTFGETDAPTRAALLHSMLLQRRFEERCAEAYALGKIGGFCHLYIGQEACGTGAITQLSPDDYVITTYRDHGQALARGITPRAVMAELFGRSDGCAR